LYSRRGLTMAADADRMIVYADEKIRCPQLL
jgi:hypothetical protein